MKRFLITVSGRTYEVEVEEVASFASAPPYREASAQASVFAHVPVAAVEPSIKAAPEPPAPMGTPATGTKIVAPMPGKILSVKVGPNQLVKRGDVLMILEAMKMENEIQSPVDGSVTAIAVSEGVAVNAGALLAVVG